MAIITPVYGFHPAPIWAPLALSMMAAQVEAHLPAYQMIYPFPENWEQFEDLLTQHGSGVLLCSNYMWTREANLLASAKAKAKYPDLIVIHGGPDTPGYPASCQTFLEAHPYIDFAVQGEGEQTLRELLQMLSTDPDRIGEVPGLSYLKAGKLHQSPPRARSADANLFPSPVLSGVYDKLNWQAWNAMPLETNRGCPYGCTFCDWGSATMQKIRLFDMERIQAEIEWMAQRKIPKLWISDSNFGIFKRDLEITQFICDTKEKYGYPKLVISNYAKNTKQHLVDIIELLVDHGLVGTGIVSLQTRDADTLKAVRRSNIKTKEYDLLRETFEKRKLPMSTQLMIGLPGSSRESFKADLRYFFNQTIDVQIFRTVVLPNSPMANPDYIAEHGLVADQTGMLIATQLLSVDELNHMEQLARLYRCAHTFGMFRYWLSYLQWEYGIDPVDFLDQLTLDAPNHPDPWIAELYDQESPPHDILTSVPSLRERLRQNGQWHLFYAALKTYTFEKHPEVEDNAAFQVMQRVQIAVMPNSQEQFPLNLNLDHDFARYYLHNTHQPEQILTLTSFEKALLLVEDPLNVSGESLFAHMKRRSRPMIIWELISPMSAEGTEASLYLVQILAEQSLEKAKAANPESVKNA